MPTSAPAREQLGSDLVVHAGRVLRTVRRRLDQPAAVRVLSLLDELGPLSVSGLAAADHCSQPTMSGIVATLLARGWVVKQPDPDDGRALLVTTTAAGAAALRDVRRDYGRAVADRLDAAGLSTEDVHTAVTVLRAVLDSPAVQEGLS